MKCLSAKWFSFRCNLCSIYGPCLCIKISNTLFTRICCKFDNWRDVRVLSGELLRQKSGKFSLFLTLQTSVGHVLFPILLCPLSISRWSIETCMWTALEVNTLFFLISIVHRFEWKNMINTWMAAQISTPSSTSVAFWEASVSFLAISYCGQYFNSLHPTPWTNFHFYCSQIDW